MAEGEELDERRVPFGIWAVAILVTLLWIIVLLDATGIRPSNSNTILADAVGTSPALNWIAGGIAIVGIVGAVALIRLKPIGFVITVVLAGIGLFNTLASELVGKGDDLRLRTHRPRRPVPQPTGGTCGLRPGRRPGPRGPPRGGGRVTTDLELLRTYEPVIRYTDGELFFPSAVEPYLAACDLLVGSQEGSARLLVSHGELDAAILASKSAPHGETLYLRLVQHPLGGLALAQWQRRPDRPVFRAPGRLARVGLFARLLDAGFNASLLLRGTVPGGTAAAASVKYEAARARDSRYVYHGRVVRRGGWIVLHYLYFYFMNDWRSTFAGANDHEADLEQAFVVLEDAPDGPRPVWFGCAAHDYSGDELRRRWDDPYISLLGDHPVIHAGAGSHAAYFEAGEYITTVPVPAFRGHLELLRRRPTHLA